MLLLISFIKEDRAILVTISAFDVSAEAHIGFTGQGRFSEARALTVTN